MNNENKWSPRKQSYLEWCSLDEECIAVIDYLKYVRSVDSLEEYVLFEIPFSFATSWNLCLIFLFECVVVAVWYRLYLLLCPSTKVVYTNLFFFSLWTDYMLYCVSAVVINMQHNIILIHISGITVFFLPRGDQEELYLCVCDHMTEGVYVA